MLPFFSSFKIIFDCDNQYVCDNSDLFQCKLFCPAVPAESIDLNAADLWTWCSLVSVNPFCSRKQRKFLCEFLQPHSLKGQLIQPNAHSFRLMIACLSVGHLIQFQAEFCDTLVWNTSPVMWHMIDVSFCVLMFCRVDKATIPASFSRWSQTMHYFEPPLIFLCNSSPGIKQQKFQIPPSCWIISTSRPFFLTILVIPFKQSSYNVSRGLEYNPSSLQLLCYHLQPHRKGFYFAGGGPNPLRFHFSASLAALIQFRAYDCNTKTERVVKPGTAMMNAPLLAVLVCFGVEGGGQIEFYAYLLRCIFLTAAALLHSGRQHWLNGIVLLSG